MSSMEVGNKAYIIINKQIYYRLLLLLA